MDFEDFEDFDDAREIFVHRYRHTPTVACVGQPSGGFELFGPFITPEEAMDWMLTVPMGVRVVFLPLRRTDKKRTANEFYLPPHMLKDDEYIHYSVTPLGKNGSETTKE